MSLDWTESRCKGPVVRQHLADRNRTIRGGLASNHSESFRGTLPRHGRLNPTGHPIELDGQDSHGPTDQTIPSHRFQRL